MSSTTPSRNALDRVIPIMYEDAPNYIRNEPQGVQRTQRKKEESQENLAQPHKEML